MKKFLDTDHPWFRPLWVRVAIVAATAGWGLFEFVSGSPFWAIIFTALAAYAAWRFFVGFNPDDRDR